MGLGLLTFASLADDAPLPSSRAVVTVDTGEPAEDECGARSRMINIFVRLHIIDLVGDQIKSCCDNDDDEMTRSALSTEADGPSVVCEFVFPCVSFIRAYPSLTCA